MISIYSKSYSHPITVWVPALALAGFAAIFIAGVVVFAFPSLLR